MSAQPEALRLADALQQQAVWEGHYGPSYLRDLLPEAATELRRLSAIESHRDELLEELKLYVFWRGYRDEHDTLLPPEMQPREIAWAMRLISKAEDQ